MIDKNLDDSLSVHGEISTDPMDKRRSRSADQRSPVTFGKTPADHKSAKVGVRKLVGVLSGQDDQSNTGLSVDPSSRHRLRRSLSAFQMGSVWAALSTTRHAAFQAHSTCLLCYPDELWQRPWKDSGNDAGAQAVDICERHSACEKGRILHCIGLESFRSVEPRRCFHQNATEGRL